MLKPLSQSLVIFGFVSAWMPTIVGADIATDPLLRLEVQQHSAALRRMDVDRAERFVVTGSHDKTARVWSIPDGRLLTVLRPPIGSGNQGKVYAVAMSPDGNTVAVGGWMSAMGSAEWIYLFDRQTGRILNRLTDEGMKDAVNDLTFSSDGRYLAAGLGQTSGIRVWRMADRQIVLRDPDYNDTVYGLTFARDGRLAATSWDGYVRLYGTRFEGLARERAPGGTRPFGVAFSPDGRYLAIGYDDTTKVSVLSAQTLRLEFEPDLSGLVTGNNNNLVCVAWSTDGQSLYAGGTYREGSQFPVFRWAARGRGTRTTLPAVQQTIMALKPYRQSGVLFGAQDPVLGAIDGQGQAVFKRGPETPDLRDQYGPAFTVSPDGSALRYDLGYGGKSPVLFDLRQRLVRRDTPAPAELQPARTEAPGIEPEGWRQSTAPTLNGKPLSLEKYERAQSVAITPDGQRVVIGADWSLRLFDHEGKQRWHQPVPDVVWGVNVTGNGQLIVAAYADGTVRWHRVEDGEELLALFIHPDATRWILWTPQGYYDAAPGADELIGWHVNRGPDQAADFFPIAKFQDTYYRPDVVAQILETLDEQKAILAANAARKSVPARAPAPIVERLPPVVKILAPADGTVVSQTQIAVTASVRSASGVPITDLKARIDGRPAAMEVTNRDAQGDYEVRVLLVTIPERDVEVSVFADNLHGTSEPARVQLRWQGGRPEAFIRKPTLYVLAVGVSTYREDPLMLKFPAKDAQDFVTALKQQEGQLYRKVVSKVLTDATATKDNILDGLQWLQRETQSDDVAMLFLSGHGDNDPTGTFYYLPQNVERDYLKRTALIYHEITTTMSGIAGKAVVFLDACHAGNVMGRKGIPDINAVVNDLKRAENGIVVFASSTGKEYSLERPEWGNGAFTKAVVEGLLGEADLLKRGVITINMLNAYVADRVKDLTIGAQHPTTTIPKTVPDFPLALRLAAAGSR